ncbi:poly-gamma-glutamate synthase PgsB [Mammaliicoccus sciuri]|uniref:poly-gamma-glutamate synthase PgsB n=1 Tax=Mammaliicoccus sciuri TaxID=1296 RepID=UPI001E38A239|nr:poly-gamma-glutamate synthase PgsB [Mammaliicoccus sciuri]MCD8898490.1 poly-gamma-glutamate synthase PgsB [Mammaliicoccus sciuri]
MLLLIILIILIILIGVVEKFVHNANVKKIPIRININGIRGKSTITRLIFSILKENQNKVIAKTTGTDARILYWYSEEEVPILRKPQGANIGEQKGIMKHVVKQNADSLVNECMAVNPDYQITFQKDLVKANVGVIVNVLEDHMDVLGPTLEDVANAFSATVPYNGKLVVMKDHYKNYFEKIAKKRNTSIISVDKDDISEEYLKKFDYIVFPDNVAIALGVADSLGIHRDIALRGMLNAPPDSGAVRVKYYEANDTNNIFINAFAANEPESSKAILDKVYSYNYPFEKVVIVLNCRSDRVDRTYLFTESFIPEIKIDTLIVTGGTTQMVTELMAKYPDINYYNFEGKDFEDVKKRIIKESVKSLVFCVGNIHGPGKKIIDFIEGEF